MRLCDLSRPHAFKEFCLVFVKDSISLASSLGFLPKMANFQTSFFFLIEDNFMSLRSEENSPSTLRVTIQHTVFKEANPKQAKQ